MEDSSYYYNQYSSYKKEASGYEKNIRVLTRIKDSLTNSFDDEQSSVNKELSDLKEDLNKSVRHNGKFSRTADECELYREKSVTTDGDLNRVVIALENEIAELNGKKTTAEENMDTQYQNYNTKKQEERQQQFDFLKDIF